MKRLLAAAMLANAIGVCAATTAGEQPLTTENKVRLVGIIEEALRDSEITQQQRYQSIFWVNAEPCTGVDRRLTSRRRRQLEVAIAKEQDRKTVKVFDSFKDEGWIILFTNASDGDEPYVFYSKDPLKGGHPVAKWSGAATIFETDEIAQWVKENAPSIPTRLANCFAWYVTLSPQK